MIFTDSELEEIKQLVAKEYLRIEQFGCFNWYFGLGLQAKDHSMSQRTQVVLLCVTKERFTKDLDLVTKIKRFSETILTLSIDKDGDYSLILKNYD